MNNHPEINFERGTLTISRDDWNHDTQKYISKYFSFDSRTNEYRCSAMHYKNAIMALFKNNIPYTDNAKSFNQQNFKLKSTPKIARDYQKEAIEEWLKYNSRACIILPTGAGKSFVAMMAIEKIKRDTLILVPTLNLMMQWVEIIESFFNTPVGKIGGGDKDIQAITVCTYDSAHLMMEYIGNRFGFLICDECHHLPGAQYQYAAIMSIAPFRLGLTATPERSDGGENNLNQLIGPICYEKDIKELSGKYLSEYNTKIIEVPLTEEEELKYKEHRNTYTQFVKDNHLNFSEGDDWSDFLTLCFKSEEGKKAYKSHKKTKEILKSSLNKMHKLYELIVKHKESRIIIFTEDNKTAYRIGELFMLPVITHQTKTLERSEFLDQFKKGVYPILVSSKVLNEGVDVPEASVGIVISGSGSKREHVQRLGRILRKSDNKSAMLYELVSKNTSEKWQSKRRRDHIAYSK
jgi:superfamily II DNA or RNA helicase